jgi:hypothetical protein
MRRGRRPQSRAPSGGPRWWRTGRSHVLWPLAVGLAFCALGLWAGLAYQHNQAAFRAQAVPARAVIDQIYGSAPSQNYTAPTFDQYGLVHFEAHGRTAHARVLLVADCSGTCIPRYRVGQVLTVYYSPGNLRYAQLRSPARSTSAAFVPGVLLLGSMGVFFLAAAVINMVTAPRAI